VALEAGEHALETFTSLQEARDLPEPLPGKKAPSRRRKTCFACMKAGKEQAQPQLYGTSYFLVKMALTGLLLDNPYLFGYCYTQLTDVSVEQNGIYTFDRRVKFDLERLHQIQCRPAAFEQC